MTNDLIAFKKYIGIFINSSKMKKKKNKNIFRLMIIVNYRE